MCKNWYFVANDDFLWKLKFAQHFNLKNNQLLTLPPASKSWKAEVKRLLFTIPSGSNSEELKSPHQLEITNVCFSRDGNFFATCGMDSRVVLWNSSGTYLINIFTDKVQVPFCEEKSVQLVGVAFFRSDFLQNLYFCLFSKDLATLN